ncbi:hypothetical protein CLV24_1527 [Pontibacter ummariensis]|uniref:Uncharacterized protein n=1 Tax=Pontibacter ummariensis TaxID=1610492 RepID=A0A239LWA9_9BACT|nr:hypothetical protein [Pontibacter ummariensis]PRY01039.1 hypothetical protein CLV24_1527 [Pontibacter ummariensis]SNT33999.1 hypothetical protein SAMN06296052_1523 [Pontibacter ummariensis]
MATKLSVRQAFAFALVTIYFLIAMTGFSQLSVLWLLVPVVPLHLIFWQNILQGRLTLPRNCPLVGYLRYFFESIRPELRQYFFKTDTDGKPFSRRQRSIV